MSVFRPLAYLCLLISFGFFFTACTKYTPSPLVAEYNSTVSQQWNDLLLVIERNAQGYRPCPAARMLGYTGLAVYESCVTGMPDYRSIANRYQNLVIPPVENGKSYNWAIVSNEVYASMYAKFFEKVTLVNNHQADLQKIEALRQSLDATLVKENIVEDPSAIDRSRAYGKAVAEAVFAYSATDPYGHEMYLNPRPSDYVPPVGPGLWKQTAPDNASAMFPYWGNVRTFAISKTQNICAAPEAKYSKEKNSLYYIQALEVYNRSMKATQSYEDQWIAEFWSDDLMGFTFSPPVRWMAIMNQVLLEDKVNMETAIYTAAKVGIALNDASVGIWNSKYKYNIERPVSYIRENIDPTYLSALNFGPAKGNSPSFPAYPSGHSGFGAAAAIALSDVFGYNYQMIDRCHEDRNDFLGKPRSFYTFTEMAEENAISRVPLGVHWRMDCEEGYNYGLLIGREVNKLPFKK